MTRRNQQHIIHGQHEPPGNEVPAAVSVGVVWRKDGAVVAVPSLLLYTTGAELLIMGRYRDPQPRTDESYTNSVRVTLRSLTVNGRPVTLLHGDYSDHGFTYRAWTPLDGADVLTIALDRPGAGPAEHRVTGLQQAASRVTVLWQER